MPSYDVVPHRGVGPVLLGMSCQESRAAMGMQPHVYRRNIFATEDTDSYLGNAFQVDFDREERVEFIELSPGWPAIAVYRGISVFETPADQLVALISQEAGYDRSDPELGYSYVFPELELAVWRPVLPEDDDDPEGRYFATIAVGRRGYFSQRSYSG